MVIANPLISLLGRIGGGVVGSKSATFPGILGLVSVIPGTCTCKDAVFLPSRVCAMGSWVSFRWFQFLVPVKTPSFWPPGDVRLDLLL